MSTKDLSWHRASLEFLDRSRNIHSKRTPIDDRSILLGVVEKWRGFKKSPKLSPTKFERTIELDPFPDSIERGQLASVLRLSPLMPQPVGKRFKNQLDSLLETNTQSKDPIVRKALVYSLGRLVCPIPENSVDWMDYPKGLDYLTNALLTLQHIERMTGVASDWLSVFNRKDKDNVPQWEVLTLRPDGPISSEWAGIINRLRTKIRSLRFAPLRMVSEHLKNQSVGKMGSEMVERVCGQSRRRSKDIWSNLQLLLTERWVPSLNLLGLRYRMRFTEVFRGFHPIGSLCETLSLTKKGMGGLRIYVEPENSLGPPEPSLFEMTADQHIVSMRMDFYDTEMDSWEPGVFEESSEMPEDTPGWLYTETNTGEPVLLSEYERYMLSILWAHRGPRSQRHVLMTTMGIAKSRSMMNRLSSKMKLAALHHPSLETLGLPDGTVVAVRGAKKKEVKDISLWLTRSFPYVEIYRDLSAGSLLAILRLPEHRGNFFASMIRAQLQEQDLDFITTTVKNQRTFYMTTLSRLYMNEEWVDHWTR